MRMLLRMYLRGDNKHLRERREERGEGREKRTTYMRVYMFAVECVCAGGGDYNGSRGNQRRMRLFF